MVTARCKSGSHKRRFQHEPGNAGKDEGGGMKRQKWTESEIATLTARYPNEKTDVLAKDMGMTVHRVYNKVFALRLKKTPEFLQAEGMERAQSEKFKASRFNAGHTTWNKGMKGLQIGGEETQFKPGNKPQTWKPIGSERIDKDGNLVRKFSDTGIKRNDWKPVHVLCWEAAHGPVPAGHIVIFNDGNKRNFDIGNLICLSRADLMNRNTVHNYPPEIQKTIQLIGALNRKINHGK
jgi:hypothetical protein